MVKAGPIAGIILAAGAATRFGGCKQLAKLRNKALMHWVLDAALDSDLDAVVLVLGSRREEILAALKAHLIHPRLQIVINPDFGSGQSSSLKAGLLKVCDVYPAVMFLLADQPCVTSAFINLLLERFRSSDRLITVPVHGGHRRTPCIFQAALYPEILRITGDRGAREVISARPADVLEVEISDPSVLRDVDAPEDLARLAWPSG
jgi:molybdenum cofactor cytidylyltransferase